LPPLPQYSMFLNPDKILDELKIKGNMIIADFGCGSGGFTIPIARRIDEGLVYGIDLMESPLSVLKSTARLENLNNIKIIKTDLEPVRGSTIGGNSVDMVFIPNVLFQVDNKSAIILEAIRILKNSGKLIIIDWLTKATQGPEEGRISKEEVIRLATDQGVKFEKEFNAGKYHYGLIFIK